MCFSYFLATSWLPNFGNCEKYLTGESLSLCRYQEPSTLEVNIGRNLMSSVVIGLWLIFGFDSMVFCAFHFIRYPVFTTTTTNTGTTRWWRTALVSTWTSLTSRFTCNRSQRFNFILTSWNKTSIKTVTTYITYSSLNLKSKIHHEPVGWRIWIISTIFLFYQKVRHFPLISSGDIFSLNLTDSDSEKYRSVW